MVCGRINNLAMQQGTFGTNPAPLPSLAHYRFLCCSTFITHFAQINHRMKRRKIIALIVQFHLAGIASALELVHMRPTGAHGESSWLSTAARRYHSDLEKPAARQQG